VRLPRGAPLRHRESEKKKTATGMLRGLHGKAWGLSLFHSGSAPTMARWRKLGRDTEHRISMMKSMATSLVQHERIETTVAKVRRIGEDLTNSGGSIALLELRSTLASLRFGFSSGARQAKELRRYIEPLVTAAKRGELQDKRVCNP
jgi:ribosomal protein L17